MSDDLIRRSDAIEAMCGNCGWRETQCDPDERFWCEDGTKIRRDIPSAEITHDDVMQYCNSRLLVLATVESIKHQYRIGFEDGKASANRPSGEWIDKGGHLWECSNCKMMIYSESEQDRSEFHKWCSRCGARMKGTNNGEDIQSTDE